MVKPDTPPNLLNLWQVFFKTTLVALLISFLVGCPSSSYQQFDFDETKNSQYYLTQVSNTSGSEKTNWQLLAIRSLIIENDIFKATQLFNQLPQDLNREQQKEKNLVEGELAIKNGQNFDLKNLSLTELSDNQKIRYYKIKIGLDGQQQDVNAQVRDYIELSKYGTQNQQHNAINDTWNFLTGLNDKQINSILVYANEPILQGWIDLIYTYRNNSNIYPISDEDDAETVTKKEEAQFNVIKNAVSEWQMQYSNHPASLYLPRNIYGEKYRLSDNPQNKSVALFLPLSGSSSVFGNIIHMGYSDAAKFYPQDAAQNIYVYDTNSDSIDNLVKQAKQQNVALIVGPLLKPDVLTIMQLSQDIPVLALNKVDSSELTNNNSNQICFFGLSPEDEATDAALHIFNQKKKHPLLILPKNNLGERVADSFAKQWKLSDLDLDGVYVQYFESEQALSKQMNAGIGIELDGELLTNPYPQANQPEQIVNLLTDTNTDAAPINLSSKPAVEFDAIYIYASHEELSLIKSMLEMKSAKVELDENGQAKIDNKGNEISIKKYIPAIYTSSRSNTANTTQDFRFDMDRVQFSDIPLITNQNQIIDQLPDYIKNDYSLVRLYAMGIDAWRLANRFNQLEPYQIDILEGTTGKLSVTKQCDITRSLIWQQYRNGKEITVK